VPLHRRVAPGLRPDASPPARAGAGFRGMRARAGNQIRPGAAGSLTPGAAGLSASQRREQVAAGSALAGIGHGRPAGSERGSEAGLLRGLHDHLVDGVDGRLHLLPYDLPTRQSGAAARRRESARAG
jgi:hypothetical protein